MSRHKESLSFILNGIAESLDIPDHLHDEAVVKYENVADWLSEEGSELTEYSPEIYAQGSFRLGTVVKPLNQNCGYDIDLVCRLAIKKESVSQAELKALIGKRLKKHDEFEKLLSESRRCWTLDWSNLFHMDVLPSIPNVERPPSGILITDKELVRWQKSNPISFADWFRGRMQVIFNERRDSLAKSREANVEDVPEWQVKTPLQRAIQLLKRHRDIYFSGSDKRPISIIITTLAAKAYGNQADLLDALMTIVAGMPSHIEVKNGRYYVTNPVDPDENFADKWNEDPERRELFMSWLAKVQKDVNSWSNSQDLVKSQNLLEPALGRESVLAGFRLAESRNRVDGLPASHNVPVVPAIGNVSHARAPTWAIVPTYRASLRAAVHIGVKKKKKLWDLTNRPVGKNLGLRFELSTNAPEPFDVYWQVVNTGNEAAAEPGGLRGTIEKADVNKTVHWEGTKYRGTHWVEAFVLKDGRCVARTGKKQVLIY